MAKSTIVIEIFSIEGKVVYAHAVKSNADVYQIDISDFPEGLYLCMINNGTCIETTKFIKQ